jgi:hypothetical protein
MRTLSLFLSLSLTHTQTLKHTQRWRGKFEVRVRSRMPAFFLALLSCCPFFICVCVCDLCVCVCVCVCVRESEIESVCLCVYPARSRERKQRNRERTDETCRLKERKRRERGKEKHKTRRLKTFLSQPTAKQTKGTTKEASEEDLHRMKRSFGALITSNLFISKNKNCETNKGHTQGGTGRSISQYSLPARGGACFSVYTCRCKIYI